MPSDTGVFTLNACFVWTGWQHSILGTRLPGAKPGTLLGSTVPSGWTGQSSSYPRLIAAFHLGSSALVTNSWVSKQRTPPIDYYSVLERLSSWGYKQAALTAGGSLAKRRKLSCHRVIWVSAIVGRGVKYWLFGDTYVHLSLGTDQPA